MKGKNREGERGSYQRQEVSRGEERKGTKPMDRDWYFLSYLSRLRGE